MNDDLPSVMIYTDGGCRPNPGPGGWGAVILVQGRDPRELSGGKKVVTNNRMELVAAIEALGAIDGPHRVELYTDSTYVRQGITEWLPKWMASGWKTAGKKRVKNRDLWQELARALEIHDVEWHWVKGHAGDRWNEVADQLASAAIPRAPLPIDDGKAVHLFTAVAYSGKKKAGSWGVVLRFADSEKVLSERVDGASAWRVFRTITLPLLLVSTAPLLIGSFAFNFNNFVMIYFLTTGGPPILDAAVPVGATDIAPNHW